jgi:hypothetical protein
MQLPRQLPNQKQRELHVVIFPAEHSLCISARIHALDWKIGKYPGANHPGTGNCILSKTPNRPTGAL